VIAVSVELDGQLVLRPTAVDKEAAGRAVGDWERQPVGLQQLARAFRRRSSLQDFLELVGGRVVEHVCLIHRPSELIDGKRRG
jgi:hypothetical protein